MNESFTLDPAVLWFIIGVLLAVSEFIIPGFVIIFFGLGALLVSLMCWMGLADSLSSQLLWFSVYSLVMLFGLRWLVKGWFVGASSQTAGGDEVSDIVGKEVRCLTAFSASEPYGKVEFKGANWKARCATPLSEGAYAIIESVDGLCLNIRPRA